MHTSENENDLVSHAMRILNTSARLRGWEIIDRSGDANAWDITDEDGVLAGQATRMQSIVRKRGLDGVRIVEITIAARVSGEFACAVVNTSRGFPAMIRIENGYVASALPALRRAVTDAFAHLTE